jgi:phytol kinase
MNAALGIAFVLVALAALFAVAGWLRSNGRIAPEHARKLVHVGLGLVCLTFPWLFHDARPVLGLAALAVAALAAVRLLEPLRVRFGCALHGVARRSYGEFAFVAGVVAAFLLAHGDALAFDVPVAVLTFADSIAALVGTRFGFHRFHTFEGTKSLEGSAAFFLVAVICIAGPLLLTGNPAALPIALGASAILTLVEASGYAGLDNLLIPVAGALLVRAAGGALAVGAW